MGHIPKHDIWIKYMPGNNNFLMKLPKENLITCGCKKNLIDDIMLFGEYYWQLSNILYVFQVIHWSVGDHYVIW